MFYIFLPSLGECGRLDTDNVSPEIANLIILSAAQYYIFTLNSGRSSHQIHNQQDSLPPPSLPRLMSPQTRLEGDYSGWDLLG